MLIVLVAATGGLLAVIGQSTQPKLPQGKWTLSAGSYSGTDYKNMPVDVFSVTTDATKGLSIVSVSLQNRTSKDVSAVKLRWYLKDNDQKQVLQEGDTPLIDIDIPAMKTQTLSYPVVSFARIHRPFLRGITLQGNYRIEIAVSEVHYADGSIWNISQISKPIFQNAAYRPLDDEVRC